MYKINHSIQNYFVHEVSQGDLYNTIFIFTVLKIRIFHLNLFIYIFMKKKIILLLFLIIFLDIINGFLS